MLDEHEIGLLAFLRQPHGEAAWIFDVLLKIVLAEGRIGKDAVVALEFVGLGLVLRAADGVLLADVGVRNTVKQHIHFADGPGGTDTLLAEKRHILGVASALADVIARLNQHAAGPARRIVRAHSWLGINDLNERAHNIGRRVELSRFLSSRVDKKLDEVFVGRAKKVGKLEILVA